MWHDVADRCAGVFTSWRMHVQVPWGMVTGPDGNLYIAMDDEFEVRISVKGRLSLGPPTESAVRSGCHTLQHQLESSHPTAHNNVEHGPLCRARQASDKDSTLTECHDGTHSMRFDVRRTVMMRWRVPVATSWWGF